MTNEDGFNFVFHKTLSWRGKGGQLERRVLAALPGICYRHGMNPVFLFAIILKRKLNVEVGPKELGPQKYKNHLFPLQIIMFSHKKVNRK